MRATRIAVAITFASTLALSGIAMQVAAIEANRDVRKFCRVLAVLDSPGSAPPVTARGIEQQQAIHQLRLDLGCKL